MDDLWEKVDVEGVESMSEELEEPLENTGILGGGVGGRERVEALSSSKIAKA